MGRINIEIKAKYNDFERAKEILKNLGASFSAKIRQVDTYYDVQKGRLKLRQSSEEEPDCLIFYEREDIKGPKRSNLKIFDIEDACQLKEVLDAALKTKIIVDKVRELWWLDNVRIHLDEVKGLGKFIEFEVVTKTEKDIQKSTERANELMKLFEIKESDLIEKSYSDLLNR